MTNRRLRIAIVGLGTAGSAAAHFFAREDHVVTVFERTRDPGPVGAGIVLQPTGMSVLAELGLLDEVVARGARLTGLDVRRVDGARLLSLDYERLHPSFFGLGIHRGALFVALTRTLTALGVTVALGVAMKRVVRSRSKDQVYTLVDDDSLEHGPFDLVVLADGARSVVASDFFPGRRSRPYPWGALWFVGDDPEGGRYPRLRQVVRGADRMIGLLPTGLGPPKPDETSDSSLVSLYYSVREDRHSVVGRDVPAFRDEVRRAMPESAPLLDQLADDAELLFTGYHDVRLWPWHEGGVVVLGDAAHAMSPQLGQGANLALFDASVLARLVREEPSLSQALARYSAERRAHLDWFQFATRTLTPFFQGDFTSLGRLRDWSFPILSRVPFFERLMIASMTGTTRGPFRRALKLPVETNALPPAAPAPQLRR